MKPNRARFPPSPSRAGAVKAVMGVATGAGSAVADAANNPDINPLQPFGAWLGGKLFDLTHPGASPYLPAPKPVTTARQNQAVGPRTYGAGWVEG